MTSALLQDFELKIFLWKLLVLGLPFFVTIFPALWVLKQVRFNLFRVPSLISRFDCIQHRWFNVLLPFLTLCIVLLTLAPAGLLLTWGIHSAVTHKYKAIGVCITFIGSVTVVFVFTFARWYFAGWRLSQRLRCGFALCVILVFAFDAATLFYLSENPDDFTYSGVSSVMLAYNSFVIIPLAYVFKQGRLKTLSEYPEIHKINLLNVFEDQDDEKKSEPSAGADESNIFIAPIVQNQQDEHLEKTICTLLFVANFLFLIGYAVFVFFIDTSNVVGFITAGALLFLDLSVFINVYYGRDLAPLEVALMLIASRFFLVIVGDRFWFIGHSIMFIFLACYYGFSIVNLTVKQIKPSSHSINLQVFETHLFFDRSESLQLRDENAAKAAKKLRIKIGMLCLTVLFFGVDLILDILIYDDDNDLDFTEENIGQFNFGIFSIFLSLIVVAMKLLSRFFQNNNLKINAKICVTASIVYALVVLAGFLAYHLTASHELWGLLVMIVCIFTPPIIFTCAYVVGQWIHADYQFMLFQDGRSFCSDFFRGQLPPHDYQILGCSFMWLAFVISLGATLSVVSGDQYDWIGYTISAAVVVLTFTSIPIIQWFNTFELTRSLVAAGVSSLIFLIVFLVLFAVLEIQEDEGGEDNETETWILGFVAWMYPTLVLLVCAVVKLMDDDWNMSRFVKISLSVGGCLTVTFIVVLGVMYAAEAGIILGAICVLIVYFSWIGYIWKRNNYFLPKKYYYTFIIAVAAILIVAIADSIWIRESAFAGFTIVMVALIIGFSLASFKRQKDRGLRAQYLSYNSVFPMYKYSHPIGREDRMIPANYTVMLNYGAMISAFFWGIFATFAFEPAFIGLGVSSIAQICIFLYSMNLSWMSLVLFNKAIQYLRRNSDHCLETIRTAKENALKNQRTLTKTIVVEARDSKVYDLDFTIVRGDGSRSYSDPFGASEEHKGDENSNIPDQYGTFSGGLSINKSGVLMIEDTPDADAAGNDSPRAVDENRGPLESLKSVICELDDIEASRPSICSCSGDSIGSKREMLERCFHLEKEVARLYEIETRFFVLFQFLVINGADALRKQRDSEINDMLLGLNENVSLEDISRLSSSDPKRKYLEDKLEQYVTHKNEQFRKNEFLQREDLEAEKRRQDEERQRRIRQAEKEKLFDKRKRFLRGKSMSVLSRHSETLEDDWNLSAPDTINEEEEIMDKIADAVKEKRCTFAVTAETFIKQRWFQCQDCPEFNGEAGICQSCKEVCHSGHEVIEPEMSPSIFYCDCGAQGCPSQDPSLEKAKELEADYQNYRDGRPVSCVQRFDDGSRCECGRTGVRQDSQCMSCGHDGALHTSSIVAKYTDREFIGDNAFYSKHESLNPLTDNKWKDLKWRRPHAWLGSRRPRIIVPPLNPNDIVQGLLGDCWFLSAIAVLSKHPDRLCDVLMTDISCIQEKKCSENDKLKTKWGVFSVKFHKDNREIIVTVDDHFPSLPGKPAFAKSAKEEELWVQILEKAYAKLYGSYESIAGGFVDQALADLTGGIPHRIDMSKPAVKEQIRDDHLWGKVFSFYEAGYMMGAGSPAGSDTIENASDLGIVQGHAYSLLDMIVVDGIRLLRLRNPWGIVEWKGKWSDGWSGWNRRMKAKVDYVDKEDGTFWMEWDDFTRNFQNIYICRFFNSQDWYTSEKFEMKWEGATAGGCTNFDSVVYNHQFSLRVDIPTTVVINLAQQDPRGTARKLFAIGIEIYKNRGRRVSRKRHGRMVAANLEGSYIRKRDVTLEAELEPYDSYTVLVSTFSPREERPFILSTYSTERVELDPLDPWKLK